MDWLGLSNLLSNG